MKNNIVVIGLNEINFPYIQSYIKKGKLPFFQKLLSENKLIKTFSEKEYELLEPWIQWVTIQTGKSYEEHKVFRLGDITGRQDLEQLFEKIEQKGKKVGAISPFNADNRLKDSPFFIPDPWTNSKTTGSWLLQGLSKAVSQSVNDNAQSKVSISSIIYILLSLVVYVPFPRILTHYLKWIKNRSLPGAKAIVLDSLLGDVFIALLKKHKVDFSWLFLNSGAHIQHHYLFNSSVYEGSLTNPEWYCQKGYDPLLAILELYDETISKIEKLAGKVIVLTGLHQQPHEHMTYYWRIKEHESFLKKIGVDNFSNLLPRMSRDFLVEFDTAEQAKSAEKVLNSFSAKDDGIKIFNVDNRGDSLFVELVYPNNIGEEFSITSEIIGDVDNFKKYIAFVAIKNGEHNGIGFLTSNFDLGLEEEIELKDVYNSLLNLA